ncbi:MAG TPA: hypothetical protein VKZ79_03835 [Alphaproteobacteria bacterium]|nr:hypothetical protein [Alphaproteobacteria bacterium]
MRSLAADPAKPSLPVSSSRVWGGPAVLAAVMLFAWVGLVAYGLQHHIYWRDEVRALTLALQAPSLLAVPAWIRGEGHPALWYMLLRAAHDLVGTERVLPAVGVTAASLGIFFFVWKAPFPLWWKACFVFSGLSVYEYSVMARNYGISMPIMFAIAFLIPRRPRIYWALAVLLFLLPQTNASSAIMTPLYDLILLAGWRQESRRDRIGIVICTIAALVGLGASFATLYPPRHDMIMQSVGQVSLPHAILLAVADPGARYDTLVHLFLPKAISGPLATIILYASTLALLPDLALFGSALLALWGTAAFYTLIYPQVGYRHAGILLVFLISLYWIRFAAARFPPLRGATLSTLRSISVALFTFLLVMNVFFGALVVSREAKRESSLSWSLSRMIAADPELGRAILLPEPEEIGESLPYYTDNDMYLAREGKYGKAATWSREAKQQISLGELLAIAERLKRDTGRPVLIMIGPHLTGAGGTFAVSYGWKFSYTPAEFADLTEHASPLPLARDATNENFDAYLLK